MSRIELDDLDRGSVERARQALADSESADWAQAGTSDLLSQIGHLQAVVGILLRVIDQTNRP
ncbi:hypothetical protein [Streptomyces sp. DH37]|uniref:hypothetical protein n=1 Tax=Streptomyces sp. DH37 TaxID=3040122 RepID=UPI0024434938|nr:hypothetical protein [Streptomyces sp. DH37]MDG9701689.1 hypothetical protein [Streptomyces sp. DH37]